jgi:hypothetical protein
MRVAERARPDPSRDYSREPNHGNGMTLTEAVIGVRDEVLAGESLSDALAFFATEAGVNPHLLKRKVQESFGGGEGHWRSTELDAQDRGRKKAISRARSVVRIFPYGDKSQFGMLFLWEGFEHVLMTQFPDRPYSTPYKAIRVFDCKLAQLSSSDWNKTTRVVR